MPDESVSEVKGWNLLWEFLKSTPIINVYMTTWYFFSEPRTFIDEVVKEDWKNKTKPPWFLTQALAFTLALLLLSPLHPLFSQDASSYTSEQKGFDSAGNFASGVIALFAASFIGHCILRKSNLPFISSFFVICYMIGALNVLICSICFVIFILINIEVISPVLVYASQFVLLLMAVYYFFVVMRHLYRPRWYALLAACLCWFVVYFIIGFSLHSLTEYITSIIPAQSDWLTHQS
jgi:hypothetical protein